jgi:hypothetical protein
MAALYAAGGVEFGLRDHRQTTMPSSSNTFASLSLSAAAKRIHSARQARAAFVRQAFAIPNILAVGVGFRNREREGLKELCLICSVDRKRPLNELSEKERVPRSFGDFRVDVKEAGRFRALGAAQAERLRPARPGSSIAHVDVTAGTFGCVVSRNGQRFMLSNNHVLANGNRARLGSVVTQPGKHDGGDARRDAIAKLVEFIPLAYDGQPDPVGPSRGNPDSSGCGSVLRFGKTRASGDGPVNRTGANVVDCAIALPDNPTLITADILGIGAPRGIGVGALGMRVQKSGRTTGHTFGDIEQIDVTSRVEYDHGTVTFTGQLMATAVSAGGDSGSAVLDMDRNVIGLLFAGSPTSTLINPIQDVLYALDVDLVI